jgi:hypothetical protein
MGSAPRRRYTTGVVVRTGRDWKHLKSFCMKLLQFRYLRAELHKRQLSLLYSILASENTKLKNLMERQLTVNKNNP